MQRYLFILLTTFALCGSLKAHSAANFQCDNTIYVTSRPFHTTSTELFTMNALTASKIRTIGMTEAYGYDAIGFSHLDGFIYGISNSSTGFEQPVLVRVDPVTGFITNLGTLPELAGSEWIVGTIIEDGTYVIGNFGGGTWLRIDVNIPAVIGGGSLPEANPLAWAANPNDNLIYGYRSWEEKLISLNPLTGEYHKFDTEFPEIGRQACSTAFRQDGAMYLYCKTPDLNVDAMFLVDVKNQTAVKISEGEALGAGDMATCAFKKDEPTKPSDFPGTWQNGNSCIVIEEDGKVHSYTKCGPFNCHRRAGTLTTYYSTDESEETLTHGLITYRGRNPIIQELKMSNNRTMRVLELNSYGVDSRFNNYDRDIYKKVKECRWKIPLPIPHPKPKPKPHPKPPTPN